MAMMLLPFSQNTARLQSYRHAPDTAAAAVSPLIPSPLDGEILVLAKAGRDRRRMPAVAWRLRLNGGISDLADVRGRARIQKIYGGHHEIMKLLIAHPPAPGRGCARRARVSPLNSTVRPCRLQGDRCRRPLSACSARRRCRADFRSAGPTPSPRAPAQPPETECVPEAVCCPSKI